MGTLTLWVVFNLFVLLLLALDLGVFHRKAHAVSLREATVWSIVWVVLAVVFNYGVWHTYGNAKGLEFLTGYLIERALSIDNIFVFLVLFQYFAVEPRFQHRVLFWGILGALIMRGAMIAAGVVLINRFHWLLYVFGAFLVWTGAKMMFHKPGDIHPENNPVFRWARKYLPITNDYEGQKFFVRQGGIWRATPMFLVLLIVESTDLAFALDSIPAIFAITQDAFIIYSSNVFAILGLRAMYFLLAGVMPMFRYLNVGLSVVLVFIGIKMLIEHWVKISIGISLGIVVGVLVVSVVASVLAVRAEAGAKRRTKAPGHDMPEWIRWTAQLAAGDPAAREAAARKLYQAGAALGDAATAAWRAEPEFASLLRGPVNVGIAVSPATFEGIRAAHGQPRLAAVPPDQDAAEFELRLAGGGCLDILTTRSPGKGGAVDRFLAKFGEGIQQVEYPVSDVDRATAILRARFAVEPIYPAKRPGADDTRVNFFLAAAPDGRKVLVELVEQKGPA